MLSNETAATKWWLREKSRQPENATINGLSICVCIAIGTIFSAQQVVSNSGVEETKRKSNMKALQPTG